ncbi:MAG TPA: tetratricopeptide repeat protein [Longimicrobiaceae bacterium]|nr:tetratricopeptide repeat protein [Longimicrobiaceae bacterium]
MSAEADDGTGPLEEILQQAASLGEEGRWAEARDLLLEQLEENAEDPALLCWLGVASHELGAEGEAYDFFRRTLAAGPEDPFILARAGNGVAVYDDPEAEPALRLAAVTAPDLPFARASYGAYLAREGLFSEAIAELEAARDLAGDEAAVRAELAIAYLLAGRREEGIVEMEEALSLDSGDTWLRALHGMTLLEVGRLEEAAETLSRVAGERPEDVELQLLSALASAAEGWEEEAWNALSRAELGAEEADAALVQEVEETIEAGAEEAREFLLRELAPSVMRDRLLLRS